MIKKTRHIILFTICVALQSCYTFSGSSLNPSIKTARIATFPNYAALQNPNLSIQFTNDLQDVFDQRTKLDLTNNNADIEIEGEITEYRQAATTVVSGDIAAQNRLTITVKVRYTNNLEEDKSFSRTFSDYADFEANQSLQQVETELVEQINERLINQIFNAIATDW